MKKISGEKYLSLNPGVHKKIRQNIFQTIPAEIIMAAKVCLI